MLSYLDFTKYFGCYLFEDDFQTFLSGTFTDLTNYNILESNYIVSELTGVEIGFTNNDAVYDDDEEIIFEEGHPISSHLNFHPQSVTLINHFPFDVSFGDKRDAILAKGGQPTQTKQGFANLLKKSFLLDHYKLNDIVVSFDFEPNNQSLNFIQVRDNNIVKHLKL